MRKKLLIVLVFVLICITSKVQAYSFSAVAPSGQTLYYNITSSTAPYKVEITRELLSYPYYSTKPTGALVIPDSVSYNGITYSVTSLGDFIFYDCYGLVSLTIPTSITSIGQYAFYGCSYLTSVAIPNSVTSIANNLFEGCVGLTSVLIPNSVTSIGNAAFYHCCSITSITIPNSVTSIGAGAFSACGSLISVTIPNSVTSIGGSAFYCCRGLTSIIIPNSVISIGNYAFHSCSGLTSIAIPNSITSIGDYAFFGCSTLTSATIPNSITSIGEYAFCGCIGLTSITIPNSITSIGDGAFSGCSGLNSITCLDTVPPQLFYGSFYNINKAIPIYVPCSSKLNYQTAPNWNTFTNFIGVKNTQNVSASICQGDIYKNYGASIDSSGVYTFVNGCDSVILNLTVTPIYSDTITAYICQGQVYNQYGFNADSTEIYTQNLQTINGCDSIITLNLTVNPSPITPSGLFVERKHSYLEITWDSVGESYEVYRDDSLIATTSQAIYQDTNVLNDSSYCYKVKAFIGNCESDFSVEECMQFVGLNDININNQDITLYPNPTNGKAKLSIQRLNDKAQVNIFDLTGRVLKTYTIDTNQKELEIDLSGYAKGVYNISINNNNTNISKKLIIQ
ncbi:MAG: flavobacterium repeat protein [Bacteroidetes bacterium]|nr:flavobacterium repeat protein [Bacteroidota bacterium]